MTWTDRALMTCDDYSTAKLCTPDGQYGEGWNATWYTIGAWKVNDMTGWNCPQCGCIGLTKYKKCQIIKKIALREPRLQH